MVFPCPCCGYLTFARPPGSYQTCAACGWVDDPVQLRWPNWANWANRPSLIEAQRSFVAGSAGQPGHERRDPGWRPVDPSQDDFEPIERGSDRAAWPEDATVLYWWRPTFWRRSAR